MLLVSCGERQTRVTPAVYLISEGVTGWVTIEYAVDGAAVFPLQDGARVISVPKAGRVQTSSPQEVGTISLRFYSVDAEARRTPIEWPAGEHGGGIDAASQTYPAPVILEFHTGTATDEVGRHVFEQFYVGRGPATDPPTWW